MQNTSYISIVIATYNEEKHIASCLESILSEEKNFESGHFEILVADGGSTDNTRKTVNEYEKKHKFIHLIHNPKKIQAAGWNIAIRKSKGNLISILGAHAQYPKNYLKECADAIFEYGADIVGGRTKAVAATDTLMNRTIAAVLSHVFGVGSSFRTIDKGPPREVDTVFSGCYKKSILEKSGLFDERFVRSQDIDLTMRIRKLGGKILLLPHVVISYFPKKTLLSFAIHNWRDGIWAIYPRGFKAFRLKFRHLAPGAFVGALLLGFILGIFWQPFLWLALSALALYLATTIVMSLHLAYKNKSLGMILTGPPTFAVRHLVYGAGTVFGYIKSLLPQK